MRRSPAPAKPTQAPGIATLMIELLHSQPLVWRQLEVPTSATLHALHHMLQAAMGWEDRHLWEFEVDGRTYGLPDPEGFAEPVIAADGTTLAQLLGPRSTSIDYRYDFGDDWELALTLSAARDADAGVRYPRYIGGERNAPPEDCGGVPGFANLLAALDDPSDPDAAELLEWAGKYDPNVVDEGAISAALARLVASPLGRARR